MIDSCAQSFQVVVTELGVEQFVTDASFDVDRKGFGIQLGHVAVGSAGGHAQMSQGFCTQVVEQQAGSNLAVVRLAFNQGAGGHDHGGVDVELGHTVVEVLQGFLLNVIGVYFSQPSASFFNHSAQTAQVEWLAGAVGQCDSNTGVGICRCGGLALLALAGVLITVEYVATGDLLLA